MPNAVLVGVCALAILSGCAARRAPTDLAQVAARDRAGSPAEVQRFDEQRARFAELRDQLRSERLERNRTPGPSTSMAPQSQERDGVRATVRPVSAEDATWNAWPDGTARLFNDGAGYLWEVVFESQRPVRWIPDQTVLAVNDTDQLFAPAEEPDAVLQHLVQGAMLEDAFGLDGDLGLRIRAADAFRRAYLSDRPVAGEQEGVVLFPAPAFRLHAVALQLTLALDVGGRDEQFVFLFE